MGSQQSAWILLPLVKCIFEDVPQLLLQLHFSLNHNVVGFVVKLSIATSAMAATSTIIFTLMQLITLGVSCAEIKDSVHTLLWFEELREPTDPDQCIDVGQNSVRSIRNSDAREI